MINVFCNNVVKVGEPMSYIGKHEMGHPIVEPFNGTNFCGISMHETVQLNDYNFNNVLVGGLINILRFGQVQLDKSLIHGKIDFNKYIKPIINGYEICEKEDSVGYIENINPLIVKFI